MNKNKEEIFIVDRIEEDNVVCENRNTGKIIKIKIQELPKGIQEGKVIKFLDGKYYFDETLEKDINKKITELWKNLKK